MVIERGETDSVREMVIERGETDRQWKRDGDREGGDRQTDSGREMVIERDETDRQTVEER